MSPLRSLWSLDPEVAFLNHGSFGACPIAVQEEQAAIRARMEREPVQFFLRALEPLLDEALASVALLTGAQADDLAFVRNATEGVSTVLASLDLAPGDELLTTDHAYNACANALHAAAARAGARVVVAKIPFPITSSDVVLGALLERVGPRTKLCLIDQITSPTALIFPIDAIVRALADRGVDALVDAAHAPGMVPMSLEETGAAYTTGNFHKWLCAPKGAAFLHVRRDKRDRVRPLVVSHGANATRADRSRFRLEFDWTGTWDPSAYLAVPSAIRFLEALPGGLAAWMRDNHEAAVRTRRHVTAALGLDAPCPDAMLGAMFSLFLPAQGARIEALHERLYDHARVEVPIFMWPQGPVHVGGTGSTYPVDVGRDSAFAVLRVSTPRYVEPSWIERLLAALRAELADD